MDERRAKLQDCLIKLSLKLGFDSFEQFRLYKEKSCFEDYMAVYPENQIISTSDDKIYVDNMKVMTAQNLYNPKDGSMVKFNDKTSLSIGIKEPPIGWWASEKYDGIRAIWDGEKLVSRGSASAGGKPKVYTYVPEWFIKTLPPGVALDGEIWISRGFFQKTSRLSTIKPGKTYTKQQIEDIWLGKEDPPVVFKVFDIPNDSRPFEFRMKKLQTIIKDRKVCWDKLDYPGKKTFPIQFTEQVKIKSMEQLISLYKKLTSEGAEGIMLRAPGSPYETKRSKYLLKYKIKEDSECVVRDYTLGEGRLLGMLGSLKCELLKDGLPSGVFTQIGTGFTDSQRTNYNNEDSSEYIPLGSVVSFSYMEMTDDGIPRHPVYRGIRDDFNINQNIKETKDQIILKNINVKGIQFKKLNEYGDFNWMIKQPQYSDVLFIYNDDIENKETNKKGKGNAIIRPFNKYNNKIVKPRSAGIPTGSIKFGGFKELNNETKKIIEDSIEIIKEITVKYNYKTVMYSSRLDGIIGSGIFEINEDVKKFITKEINDLSNLKYKEIIKTVPTVSVSVSQVKDILTKIINKITTEKSQNWNFKIRFYIKALEIIKDNSNLKTTEDYIAELRKGGMELKGEEEFKNKNGTWKSTIVQKIDTILKTGQVDGITNDVDIEVVAIQNLTKIPQIGPSKASELYKQHGITTIEALKNAYVNNKKIITEKQAIGLTHHDDLERRIPREEMDLWNEILTEMFNETLTELKINGELVISGSYRRQNKDSGDVDALITTDDYSENIMDNFYKKLISKKILTAKNTISKGPTKTMAVAKIDEHYRHLDIFYHERLVYPFALLFTTGSKELNIDMRNHAIRLGYSLNQRNIRKGSENGPLVTAEEYYAKIGKNYPTTEKDIFDFLDFKYIEPKNR